MSTQQIQISIDAAQCKNCGLCVLECANHSVLQSAKHVDFNNVFCDKCLHCFAICPNQAIVIDKEFDANFSRAVEIQSDSFQALLKKRRSTRRFVEKEIPGDVVEKLLEAARYIPSGGNSHEMTITIVRAPEKKRELREKITAYYERTMKLVKNPLIRVLLKFVGDEKVKESIKDKAFLKKIDQMITRMHSDEDIIFYNAPLIMLFHTKRILPTAKEDCILAAYNIALTAELYGLGSCFVSLSQQALTANRNCKAVAGMDKDERVHAVLVIGYPKYEYRRAAYRSPKNVTRLS